MADDESQDTEGTEGGSPPLKAGVEDAWLAGNIREARKRARMSQGELARRMAELGWPWHQQTVRRAEDGSRKIIAGELQALARILGMRADRLMMPGREASAMALLERSVNSAQDAWEQIARWAESLSAAQRQLALTVSETEAADFRDSPAIAELLREAREALGLTAESAFNAAGTGSGEDAADERL